jgi:hypothetical protein
MLMYLQQQAVKLSQKIAILCIVWPTPLNNQCFYCLGTLHIWCPHLVLSLVIDLLLQREIGTKPRWLGATASQQSKEKNGICNSTKSNRAAVPLYEMPRLIIDEALADTAEALVFYLPLAVLQQ